MSQLTVWVNAVPVRHVSAKTYFQYDVIISTDSPKPLNKRQRFEIIDKLQIDNPRLFNPRAVYDGRSIMFSQRDIPSTPLSVVFGSVRPKTFTISLTRVGSIDTGKLGALLGKQPGIEAQNLRDLKPLNLLQLIVRQAPNMTHRFPLDAQSFYVDQGQTDLRCGLLAWRGFFQSVRPTVDRLIINIDSVVGAVYQGGPLLTVMQAWLNIRDARGLERLEIPDFNKLKAFLKGVYVEFPAFSQTPRRTRPISKLVPQGGLQEFEINGQKTTVQAYFLSKYGVQTRYPRAPGVLVGKTAIIPAEFCIIVPGQLYRKALPPQATNNLTKMSIVRPSVRLDGLRKALERNTFHHSNSDVVQDAGLEIGGQLMQVRASILPTPEIMYQRNIKPELGKGAWNIMNDTKFGRPGTLHPWAVINFSNRRMDDVMTFVGHLIGNMVRHGMQVNPNPYSVSGVAGNARRVLEDALSVFTEKPRPLLFLIFLPDQAADCRQTIKHWGDIKQGVLTQCLREGKWSTNTDGRSDQYRNNVALKINTRLRGANSTVALVQRTLETSMIVGADVGHPGPGVGTQPSVAGLVAMVGTDPSMMTAISSVQEPRKETITEMQGMMQRVLNKWLERRKDPKNPRYCPPPPSIIWFFRDGVSEGEYEAVAHQEISAIKSAFTSLRIPQNLLPKIVYVVVGKRHHVRFFPIMKTDEDRSGNCKAGLLVNQTITNAKYDEFYLLAHAGLLGTSRPGHYVTLCNEPGIPQADIENMAFALCHVYASATRSVSIPAPVYYADRLCARLPFHCARVADGAGSEVTGASDQPFDLERWKKDNDFRNSPLCDSNFFI